MKKFGWKNIFRVAERAYAFERSNGKCQALLHDGTTCSERAVNAITNDEGKTIVCCRACRMLLAGRNSAEKRALKVDHKRRQLSLGELE